jgi:hypothetical protein
MKSLEDIRVDFNSSVAGDYSLRKARLADFEFAFISESQWAGSYADNFQNKPRPVFNKIARYINRVIGQKQRLAINARIISASNEATDEDAEVLQSIWRNDQNRGDGAEARENADLEAFTCGMGAIKLTTRFEDEENPDNDRQMLQTEEILSAVSSVFFNAGAIKKDKSDAKQGWHLVRANRRELEEEFGVSIASYPQSICQTYYFDWNVDSTKDVYVAHYYEVSERKVTEYVFDINGAEFYVKVVGGKRTDAEGNEIDKKDFEELVKDKDIDFEVTNRKEKVVEYALLSGDQFLIKPRKTVFKEIPIKVQYGYHIVINGVSYWWGEATLLRDPQLYFNSYMSAMMQIMSESQISRPEYTPEQIARYANQRTKLVQDNPNFLMSDPIKNKDGSIAHLGPVAQHQPPSIGTGLQASGQQLESLLAEIGGTGQSTVPANVSADAITQINQREDDTYQTLFQNSMHNTKALARCWIPAAQKIYFSNPRQLRALAEDGSYSQIETLAFGVDDNGDIGNVRNKALGKYDVEVKAGESYQSKKEAEKAGNLEILQFTDTATPKGQMVLNNVILASTGEGTADLKRIARFENIQIMLSMGIDPQPKTDEERQYIQQLQQQQANQGQQPDPNMILAESEAQARIMEGQAALQNEQNDAQANQIKAGELQLKAGALNLKQRELEIKAADMGVKMENTRADTASKIVDIENKQVDTASKRIDNGQKMFNSLIGQSPA